MQRTIEQARQIIAEYWRERGERQFAREVLAGSWDYRRDVQAAVAGDWTSAGYRFRKQS